MQNPYNDVLPDVLNRWRTALRSEDTLPRELQVQRYMAEHRDNPEAMATFFMEATEKGYYKPDQVAKEMGRYARTMEAEAKKRDKQMGEDKAQRIPAGRRVRDGNTV